MGRPYAPARNAGLAGRAVPYAWRMICPACGVPVPEGARFCSDCGREIRPQSDERRVVTVLFGDLVGFTSLSERLDPEHLKNLVDRCFDRLATDVNDFGGQVDKVIGDAIVCLFGAPVAHEDDAERAVRAALRMQQTMIGLARDVGHDLRMRIGVNTGEVLVGAMRAAGSITAMGDVVNTASRLQTSGRPGEVLVGPATHAATQAVIRYEARGPLNARGREEPVEAWVAVEPTLPPGYRARRIDVPVVGREHELGLLHHAVDAAITHERALFTLLVGDPGLGKTRLAEEVGDWAGVTHGATVLEGRCVPYGEANVWWPIAEALRSGCGVDADSSREDARAATSKRVAQAFERPGRDPEVERTVEGLLILMGYETSKGADPASVREEAVRSLVTFVEQTTRHAPLVIQLSDLHWADELVLNLLEELFERLHHRPAIVIATARPALSERWAPPPGRHNTLVLHVDPLGRKAAGILLEALMGCAPSDEVADALVERSGGNPFFLEELVSLLEGRDGASAGLGSGDGLRFAELPDTLRGLVAARLDDLDADSKGVLQDAAVIGRHASVSGLREMAEQLGRSVDVDAAVRLLVEKEILVVEDGECSFRSDLVREVAYQTITKYDRTKRHIGIARYLELVVWPNQPGSPSLVDQLAAHYGTAVELADELGASGEFPDDVRSRALYWITRAAEQARTGNALTAAVRLYSQALRLVGDAEPSEAHARLRLGRGCAHEESWNLIDARADAEAAAAESAAVGEAGLGARALVLQGEVLHKEGDSDAALATLREALDVFEQLGDDGGRGEALRQMGMVDLLRGRLEDAERSSSAALDAFTAVTDARGQAWALQNLAWIAFLTGRANDADERLQRSVATFADLGDTRGMAWSLGLLAFVRMQQARLEEAEALGEQVLEEARSSGDRWASGTMLTLLSGVRLWTGRTEEAVRLAGEARDLFCELGDAFGETQAFALLGRSLAMLGRVPEGFAALDQALASATRGTAEEMASVALMARVATSVQVGEPTAAEPALAGLAAAGGIAGHEGLIALGLHALQSGDPPRARTLIERALGADDDPAQPSALAAMALVGATDGAADVGALADRVAACGTATYLDLTLADIAAALVAGRDGRRDDATRRLDASDRRTAATGDRLMAALITLARTTIGLCLGDPNAEEAVAAARSHLEAFGTSAVGWTRVFDLATGSRVLA
ncbi:MAG: hypothetical protein JWN46_1599 [Acidimicrobiales bacterium]|nr:hypothetical protein [Acidimicrobiales bacterium]